MINIQYISMRVFKPITWEKEEERERERERVKSVFVCLKGEGHTFFLLTIDSKL
jgi:hypothetical protein